MKTPSAWVGLIATLLACGWLVSRYVSHPPSTSGTSATGATTEAPLPASAPIPSSPRAAATRPGPSPTAQDLLTPLRRRPVLSEEELIAQLNDPAQSLKVRGEAARALAAMSSAPAVAAIRQLMASGPPFLRAAAAQGLGRSPTAESRDLLATLVKDPDEEVAQGAVRGWAEAGDRQAVDVLSELLADAERPGGVRTEAALGLGDLASHREAFLALTNAALQLMDEVLAPAVLEGLGRREIGETQDFFREYLAIEGLPTALRSAAVEALGQAQGDSSSLVLEFIGDPDPAVRASAAWTLSTTVEAGHAAEHLTARLNEEPDPTVRLRLYQALANQEGGNPATIIPLIEQETAADVRLSGFDYLGQACQATADPALHQYFDSMVVPQLQALALGGDDRQSQLSAVIALRRVQTPGTTDALDQIARQSLDPQIANAARGPVAPPSPKP